MKRFLILVLSVAMISFAACDDEDSTSSGSGKALTSYPANGSYFKLSLTSNNFEWKTAQNPVIYKYWNAEIAGDLVEEGYITYFDLYVSDSNNKMTHVDERMTEWEWNDDYIWQSGMTMTAAFEKAGVQLQVGKTYYWQVAVTLPDGTYTMSDKMSFTVVPSDPTGFAWSNEQGNTKLAWSVPYSSVEYGASASPVLCDVYVSTSIPVVGVDTPVASNVAPSTFAANSYTFWVNSKNFEPVATPFLFTAGTVYYVTIVTKCAIAPANTALWNVTEVVKGAKFDQYSTWTTTICTADFNYDTTLYTTPALYLAPRYMTTTGTLDANIGSNYSNTNSYPSLRLTNIPTPQTLSYGFSNINNFSSCTFTCDFRIAGEANGFDLVFDDSAHANTFIGTNYNFTTPSTGLATLTGNVISVRWWNDDPRTTAANDPMFVICGYSIAADDTVDIDSDVAVVRDGDTNYDILEAQMQTTYVKPEKWHHLTVVRTGTSTTDSQVVITLDGDTAHALTVRLIDSSLANPEYPYNITRWKPNQFTLTARSAMNIDNVSFAIQDTNYTRAE